MKVFIQKLWRLMDLGSTTFIIIGFGLLIRLVVLMMFVRFPLADDALSYHEVALQLLRGENFSPYWPPGLPCWLAFFYQILGTSEVVGRVSMLLFYLLFSAFIFLLIRNLSSTRMANMTVLFFSVFPMFILHSVDTQTQLPTATCLVGIAYLSLQIITRPKGWHIVVLGLMLALLVLTRASTIPLLALIPGYLYFKTRNWRTALTPFLIGSVLVGGWIFKAHTMTGRWIMINEANSKNFFLGNNPYTPLYRTWWFGSHKKGEPGVPPAYTEMVANIIRQSPEGNDQLFLKSALNHMVTRPDLFLVRTANRIRNYFAFYTFTGSYLIKAYSVPKVLGWLVIGGDALFYWVIMLAAIRYLCGLHLTSPPLETILFLLLLGASYAGPYWISFSHPTYHFPIVPLLAVLAALFFQKKITLTDKDGGWFPSGRRKFLFLMSALIFFYVQIEWVFMMRSRL